MKIKLNSSRLSLSRLIPRDRLDSMRRDIQYSVALKVVGKLKLEAARQLTSFSDYNAYVSSIYIDQGSVPVVGVGEEGLELEKPKQSIDLKQRFQASLKAKKTAKGGWYLTIPMTHKSPAAIGGMPWAVYNAIKLGKKLSLVPGSRAAFYDPILMQQVGEYKHKASIYAGIKKIQGVSKAKGSYVTMRRVSNNSDPLSWIIKARQARPISDNVLGNINFSQLVRETLSELT